MNVEKRHSNVYDSIGKRYSIPRNKLILKVIVSVLVLAFLILSIVYWHRSNAMIADNYAVKVHHCISEYRNLNQYSAALHLNPQDCVNDPNIIK